MPTPPTWTYDATDNAYTLIVGDIHCRIRLSAESWAAIMSQRATIVALANFGSLEAAKAWCEALLAERRTERS